MNKRRKLKKRRIVVCLLIFVIIIFALLFLINFLTSSDDKKDNNDVIAMLDLSSMSVTEIEKYVDENNLILNITYEYNDEIETDKVISQSIEVGSKINNEDILDVVISLGKIDKEKLANDKINELGKVPVMMYHGIIDKKSSETNYTGGNVDKDGYSRTYEAFIEDLEFYYQEGYRMARLIDYVNGNIDTEYGKSPIVLTFDDGNANNIKVTGLDSDGNIIIDSHSAVGILESFKEKYPDYNVTATFFVTDALFNQPEYNEKILEFLVNNGYDIGNHTKGHSNINKLSTSETENVIGYVYNLLNSIIPNKYVNIVALPFGNPTSQDHPNFKYVINGIYDNLEYRTISALRVGWEPEVSPYNKDFNILYVKRCRAYDNEGKDFDIEMVYRMLEATKYISDGNSNTIVTSISNESKIIETTKEIILY